MLLSSFDRASVLFKFNISSEGERVSVRVRVRVRVREREKKFEVIEICRERVCVWET